MSSPPQVNNDTEKYEDDFVPYLGMEFGTIDEAWSFWNYYGGRMDFGARKGCGPKSKLDGIITSKLFHCNCEGTRREDKRDALTKKSRAKTRTNCQARLQIKFDRESQKYKVVEFVSEHTHPLQKPEACYLIPSQRKVSEVSQMEIQLADSSRIRPKEAHQLHSNQSGGIRALGYTDVDHNNCLRDMRKQVMKQGPAVAMTKYFARRVLENPSFRHFEDITEGEISNILWTDAKMIAAYARFGDVLIFDTTFGTNKESWACGVFAGFNHFREVCIFGAALMCDQSKPSFEWVFKKFLEAHGDKKPVTIFTDQDKAIGGALKNIMPDTRHCLCTWHISQNCAKNLGRFNKDEISITGEFSACMYRYEEEDDFEKAFKGLKEKCDDSWLDFIYDSREKWARCFLKDAYTLGIRSTQASESTNATLKNYVNCKLNMHKFLENFDMVLDRKREKEIKSDYGMTFKLPRIKIDWPILCDAGELYTPKVFDLFQAEFELSGSAEIKNIEGDIYIVGMADNDNDIQRKSRQVFWIRDDQIVSCSCKKFEREGILCWHALKVLYHNDIKKIPSRYILKRWTKAAADDIIVDGEGRQVVEDAMLKVRNRKSDLLRTVISAIDKAAKSEGGAQYLRMKILVAIREYEEKFENVSRTSDDGNSTSEHSLHLKLKKKSCGDKRSRRNPSWIEKLPTSKKGKNKNTSSNNQDSLRSGANLSQDISGENFGCYRNLEDIYDLTITQ